MAELEHLQESEKALAEFMEAQRQKRIAFDILATAFRDAEIDPQTVSGNEADADYEDAKQGAKEYARARNSGARVRQYNEHNESAREGVRSALDWIARKRKSAIRK